MHCYYIDTGLDMWKIGNMAKSPIKLPNKPFSTKEAVALGLSKITLTRMVKSGLLERLSRGIYQVVDDHTDIDSKRIKVSSKKAPYTELEREYISATLKCGHPSAVCLLSALQFYNLTDEIPNRIWMMVPESKRVRSEALKIVRCRQPKWDQGFHKNKDFWITTIERTLIDCIVYKRIVGQQVALSALKLALSEKKIKLGNLYEIARSIGAGRALKPYIEILGA